MSFIRRHKVLSALGITFFILVLALASLIYFSETIIRNLTQKQGSAKIGRELVIEGPLSIKWGWTKTKFHAEKIRLGNAEGYKEPDMVSIDALDFTFAPAKLLIGRLEFGHITLDKPAIVLEKKSAEDANWNFPALSSANATQEAVTPGDRHDFPVIGRLLLKDGSLTYRDAVKKIDMTLTLDSANGKGGSKDEKAADKDSFKISGSGSLQGQKFRISASGGSIEMLRDSSVEFPLQLDVRMGSTHIAVDGTFEDPVKMTGVDTALKIEGNNLADLFYLTNIPLPPSPPYSFDGRLTKKGDVFSYNRFKGRVGGSDLSGDLSYDIGKEPGYLKAALVSNLLDGRDLGGFIGLTPSGKNAAPEQKQEAAKKAVSPRLIPDVPLKLDRLRATNLDVSLKAKKIEAEGIPFKGMDVTFHLKDGLLRLDPLNVVLADGTVDGMVELDGGKDIPPVKTRLNLRRLSLKQFFAGTRFEATTRSFFGGKINLSGRGKSLADVLATSNGELAIVMSGGTISNLIIEASDLDIGQAIPYFLAKDEPTELRCGVIDFEVNDGILNSKIFVIDTADSLLRGRMGIDLKRELISAKLDAKPKDVSLLSLQSPIVVSGSLKKPSVGVDAAETGTRTAVAAALGTLLTPLAAIIPFIEIGKQQNAPCRALIAEAQK